MNIIILGAAGSGKGTQADLIAQEYRIPHISTGDIFRENMKNHTPLGIEAQKYIDKGNLVPDDVTNNMVRDRLGKHDCRKGYILDGYPRTLPQLQALFSFSRVDTALDIELSDDEVIHRISGRRVCGSCGKGYHVDYLKPKKQGICDACGGKLIQRTDDTPVTVKNRLEIYHRQSQPIIDELKKKGILKTIDGSPSIEDVFKKVKSALVR